MTKLIVAFRNFANAPKNGYHVKKSGSKKEEFLVLETYLC